MKKQILFGAVALAAVLLFSACNDQPPIPEDTTAPATAAVTTEAPTEAPVDPFRAVRMSDELWLSYGLAAYEKQTEPQDLSEFLQNQANHSYLTLYDDMFVYDYEKTLPVAEAFFRFVCDEYGVDALLDMDKRCEYKTAYLHSLGLEMEYIQLPEVEAFLASMKFSTDFSSDNQFPYIFTFGNVHYHFKHFDDGPIAAYHGILYYSTTGLGKLIDYVEGLDDADLFNTDREFHYYMTLEGGASHTRYATGNMYINTRETTLHEAVHAMGIHLKNHLWLSEGLCEYFSEDLGFYPLITDTRIQTMRIVGQGYYDELAAAGNQTAIVSKAVYDAYIAAGGSLDSIEAFDTKLFRNINLKVEAEMLPGSLSTLGKVWESLNNAPCTATGAELTYGQAGAMVSYLVETYGLSAVLDAFRADDPAAAFGKDYEALKAEWLEYLYQ